MNIPAFAVDKLAEHSKAAKVERKQFLFAVTAIFKLHTVNLALLRRLHQFPALFNKHRAGHFDKRMLAGSHRIKRNRGMRIPRSRIVDDIDIRKIAKSLISILRAAKRQRAHASLCGNCRRGALGIFRTDIANGDNRNIRHHHQAIYCAISTRPSANDTDTNIIFYWCAGKIPHRRTFRSLARPFCTSAPCHDPCTCRHGNTLYEFASVRRHIRKTPFE